MKKHLLVAMFALLLSWQDNSNNEDGFVVERLAPNETEFSVIGYAPVDATTFVDPVVIPLARYRVAAFNSAGQSGYSNEAQVPPIQPPCTPRGKSGKCK